MPSRRTDFDLVGAYKTNTYNQIKQADVKENQNQKQSLLKELDFSKIKLER